MDGNSSIFEKASRVFDGWTDSETGYRVLCVFAENLKKAPGMWSTFYHQHNCFLDNGRQILLHASRKVFPDGPLTYAIDLTTGLAEEIIPPDLRVVEIADKTKYALLRKMKPGYEQMVMWDLRAGKELASLSINDWICNTGSFLSDGKRALIFYYRGQYYTEPVQSRHWMISPDEEPRIVMDVDGYYCSHVQGYPVDSNLYSFDKWPSPKRDIDQTLTMRAVDGTYEETVKLDKKALRPGDMWGCRDHYVWTLDGKYIVSYLCPKCICADACLDAETFNHFKLNWWLSVLDWRTGEDLSAEYPEGRWGGHMQVTPNSRYIIACGGNGFDKLFAVNIEKLKDGWNESIICSYPKTTSLGNNSDPFPQPFVLPDGSGVVFNAGWHGPEYGVYLAEIPADMR